MLKATKTDQDKIVWTIDVELCGDGAEAELSYTREHAEGPVTATSEGDSVRRGSGKTKMQALGALVQALRENPFSDEDARALG